MIRLALAAVALAAAAPPARVPQRPPASQLSPRVDNPWFPLVPGTRYLYRGVRDGKPSRDVVTVTRRTHLIDGVRCAVVLDRLFLDGRLAERTTDWYAQDRAGNVWYLGENTAELDARGRVTSTEGTWQSGADGAHAGILMPGRPRIGVVVRQEYRKGQAEDYAKVIGVFGKNAVLTQEWTPLEPGTIDHKLYVRGVGTVLEHTEKGGQEHAELISITRAR